MYALLHSFSAIDDEQEYPNSMIGEYSIDRLKTTNPPFNTLLTLIALILPLLAFPTRVLVTRMIVAQKIGIICSSSEGEKIVPVHGTLSLTAFILHKENHHQTRHMKNPPKIHMTLHHKRKGETRKHKLVASQYICLYKSSTSTRNVFVSWVYCSHQHSTVQQRVQLHWLR